MITKQPKGITEKPITKCRVKKRKRKLLNNTLSYNYHVVDSSTNIICFILLKISKFIILIVTSPPILFNIKNSVRRIIYIYILEFRIFVSKKYHAIN